MASGMMTPAARPSQLELIGERWPLLIVRQLMFGERRFSDLCAGLPGISAKVLTERVDCFHLPEKVR